MHARPRWSRFDDDGARGPVRELHILHRRQQPERRLGPAWRAQEQLGHHRAMMLACVPDLDAALGCTANADHLVERSRRHHDATLVGLDARTVVMHALRSGRLASPQALSSAVLSAVQDDAHIVPSRSEPDADPREAVGDALSGGRRFQKEEHRARTTHVRLAS